MQWICSFLMFLGRLCLGGLFLWAAFDKILNYQLNMELIASKGITLVPFFLLGACLVEFLGSLSLIFGYRIRFGALILLVYLIPTTLIFHEFWVYGDEERYLQTILFLKNVAIFGGLLYVLACGGGCCSCDNARRKKAVEE